ncbi:hypothetical protein MPRM_25210 [Mycobacterium parmense]|uniref:Uncharacterized protein n=1 Tax=Mycobacterium parmense TaxID=185642 RepID=A0A7I7YU01_9MYCO|nr:hypothetical protein MPRM_25210 [Mycobacterium parmense]
MASLDQPIESWPNNIASAVSHTPWAVACAASSVVKAAIAIDGPAWPATMSARAWLRTDSVFRVWTVVVGFPSRLPPLRQKL